LILGVSFRYSGRRDWRGVKRFTPWLGSSVRYMRAEGAELVRIGRRRAKAKAAFEKVNDEAKAAVVAAAEAGVPEAELARVLQVDRMTVRSWLGKRR
jgi:DNA-directed RNA polymerase specialized sigma24 family protein